MAKKPGPRRSLPAAKRRGRPPKPGGQTPQVEVQRAYRARLKAAGKVVRVVDAFPASPISVLPAMPDFNPATQMVCDREYVDDVAH